MVHMAGREGGDDTGLTLVLGRAGADAMASARWSTSGVRSTNTPLSDHSPVCGSWCQHDCQTCCCEQWLQYATQTSLLLRNGGQQTSARVKVVDAQLVGLDDGHAIVHVHRAHHIRSLVLGDVVDGAQTRWGVTGGGTELLAPQLALAIQREELRGEWIRATCEGRRWLLSKRRDRGEGCLNVQIVECHRQGRLVERCGLGHGQQVGRERRWLEHQLLGVNEPDEHRVVGISLGGVGHAHALRQGVQGELGREAENGRRGLKHGAAQRETLAP